MRSRDLIAVSAIAAIAATIAFLLPGPKKTETIAPPAIVPPSGAADSRRPAAPVRDGLPPQAIRVPRRTIDDSVSTALGWSDANGAAIEAAIDKSRRSLQSLALKHATAEKLGDDETLVTIATFPDQGAAIEESLKQEMRRILGDDRFGQFENMDAGYLAANLDQFGKYPRLIDFRIISREGFPGGLVVVREDTIRSPAGVKFHQWTEGRLPRNRLGKYEVFSDVVPRLPAR